MKTDPFKDTWLYFAGQWPDQTAIGVWRWLFVGLFVALLVASVVIAVSEWRADPGQRSLGHIGNWAVRVLVGGMWWVNTLWKLPFFTDENGLNHWVEEEQKSAAFSWLGSFIGNYLLPTPQFYVLDVLTFFLETGFRRVAHPRPRRARHGRDRRGLRRRSSGWGSTATRPNGPGPTYSS